MNYCPFLLHDAFEYELLIEKRGGLSAIIIY